MDSFFIFSIVFVLLLLVFVLPLIVLRVVLSHSAAREAKEGSKREKKTDDDDASVESAIDKLKSKPFVLVHAHADDEAMFFLPTLLTLREQMPAELYSQCSVVCFTSDPLIRAEEYFACATTVLGLSPSQIHVLHSPGNTSDDESHLKEVQSRLGSALYLPTEEDTSMAAILDGFQYHNSKEVIAEALERILTSDFDWNNYNFITFDGYGVSGHLNHIDVSRGVLHACKEHGAAVFTLDSVPLAVKYVPALFSLRYMTSSNDGNTVCTYSKKASNTLLFTLTKVYRSQLTWYRCCFAMISMYAYCNTLHITQ